MSFQSQYAEYNGDCSSSKINIPLKVPFMNSVASTNIDNNNITSVNRPSNTGEDNKYYINSFSKKEFFTGHKSQNNKSKTNDFALGWTCTQRDNGTWYCPLRGDIL